MADRIAAFGGCLVVNRPMDKAAAELVSENYLEVVAAPDFEPALSISLPNGKIPYCASGKDQ
jgi:AICAR transformylase/IMP cyclohydrolase PurH